MSPIQKIFTISQAAKRIGVSKSTLRRWVKLQKIQPIIDENGIILNLFIILVFFLLTSLLLGDKQIGKFNHIGGHMATRNRVSVRNFGLVHCSSKNVLLVFLLGLILLPLGKVQAQNAAESMAAFEAFKSKYGQHWQGMWKGQASPKLVYGGKYNNPVTVPYSIPAERKEVVLKPKHVFKPVEFSFRVT